MTPDDVRKSDEELAALLARYDEMLAMGAPLPSEPRPDREWVAMAELEGMQECLRLLEDVWPRSGVAVSPSQPLETGGPITSRVGNGQPAVFGRFRVERELGRGGFGVVFLAHDPLLGRHVALKLPRPEGLLSPDVRRRFLREAHAAAGLDHPNLVPVYEAGEFGAVCYIASAFCEGPTLSIWMRDRSEPVPPRLAAQMVAVLADGVQHAHEKGILHRDLKPSNVILQVAAGASRGGALNGLGMVPRITDFGLARLIDHEGEATVTCFPIGTAPYMSPEQAEGRPDAARPQVDIYGLGAILYALLCGRPPHRGRTEAEALKHALTDDPDRPRTVRRGLPLDLESIVLKCLERNPARRYESAAALAEDLRRFLEGLSTRARPVGLRLRAWRRLRRLPAAAWATAMALVALGSVGVGVWQEYRRAEARAVGARDRAAAQRREDELTQIGHVATVRLAHQFLQANHPSLASPQLERLRVESGPAELAGFERAYLEHLAHQERVTLRGHEGDAYHVRFSPDGRTLASAGKDQTVRLWNVADGRCLAVLTGHGAEVASVEFSPDGRSLASAGEDRSVRIWEVPGGRPLRRLDGFKDDVVQALFSADGRRLFIGSRDGTVQVRDLESGRVLSSWDGRVNRIEALAVSPDDSVVAVAGRAESVRTFRRDPAGGLSTPFMADAVLNPDPTRRPDLPRAQIVFGVAFSRDGRTLAAVAAADAWAIRLWGTGDWTSRGGCRGHSGDVYSVAFSPDGHLLASAALDLTVRLWDVNSAELRDTFLGHSQRIWCVTFASDGRSLATASADGTIKLWDVPRRPPKRLVFSCQPYMRPGAIAFSADNRRLTAFVKEGTSNSWDVRTTSLVSERYVGENSRLDNAALSPDGDFLVGSKDSDVVMIFPIWKPAPGRALIRQDAAGATAVLPDGRLLTIVDQREVRISDSRTGRELGRFPMARTHSTAPVISPAGDVVVFGGDGTEVWDFQPGKAPTRRTGISTHLYVAERDTFSPDGRFFAQCGADHQGVIHLFDGRTLDFEHRRDLLGHVGGVNDIAFTPDSRCLASAGEDGTVRLWNVATGQELFTIEKHSRSIERIAFAPDGRAWAWCVRAPDGTFEVFFRRLGNE